MAHSRPSRTPLTSASAARSRRRATPIILDKSPADGDIELLKERRMLRVLCVDDHALLIEGLAARFAIEGGIEIVGRLANASRLLEEFEHLQPDVVVLDIEMPGPDAFEVTDRLTRRHADARVMVLSAYVRDAFLTAAFRAGVVAYFSKTDELVDIVRGLYEVAKAKPRSFLLGPKARERCKPQTSASAQSDRITSVSRKGVPPTLLSLLTARETEILRYIGKGLSRTQIGIELCRSTKTVDAHQARMMKKLGLTTRADLLRFAIREGLAQA